MAYIALLWKARTIEKYRLKYEKEKINSILASNTELPSPSLYQKWTVYRNDSLKRQLRIFRNKTCSKEHSNFVLAVVIAVAGVMVLIYFLYQVLALELIVWTLVSWIIGIAIVLGFAFSFRVRCLVLLLIPGLFSRLGRYTLACYALVLILTGPAANTLRNLETLSHSLACGQEQVKTGVKQIKESKDNPLNIANEAIGGIVEKIQILAGAMKNMTVKIHRLTMSIAHVLQSSLSWLNSVESVCNKEIGASHEHCYKILTKAIAECKGESAYVSSYWDWKIIIRAICFTSKSADQICVVGDFAKGSIIATVKKKLNTYANRLRSLLYMSMHIRRSHTCCSNGSLPVDQAPVGIVTDLRNRADPLFAWLSWSYALTGLFTALIIFRAKYYQHMFRTRSRFDNRYVTKELRDLDLQRKRQDRETVLPLNTRERAKYVSPVSLRLLPSEKMFLTRSIVFMFITTFKLMIHMVADYCLYWVLMNIRFHGSAQTNDNLNRTANILVSGSGPLAAVVRMLVEGLSVPLVHPLPSPNACLPNPTPPDMQRYAHIGTLIMMLWLLALFEPYGLRLRHVITGHYQPERAKARAVWLFYHIIRTRSCFLKYARRKLHRQFKYTSEKKFTLKNWLNSCIPPVCWRCRWFWRLLGLGPDEPHCLLCYTKHRQDDLDRHLKRCDTTSCPGVFCARCFMDIGQLCTICYSPEDYGDLSDVSLEKFVSDDSETDDSDDDDDNIHDCKSTMGSPAYEMRDDENGMPSELLKKNKICSMFSTLSRNHDGDQESKPLLSSDYLNKDYNHREILDFKYENIDKKVQKENHISSHDLAIKYKATVLNKNENSNWSQKSKLVQLLHTSNIFPRFLSDTEITVNGLKIPKEKLDATKKTMKLLTSKENGQCNKYMNTVKQKPLEYLIMHMYQPPDIFKKISLARRTKYSRSRKFKETSVPFKGEIPFTNNVQLSKTLSNVDVLLNIDLPNNCNSYNNSEPGFKHDPEKNKNRIKLQNFSKWHRNKWFARHKVKRYLEIKNTISGNIIKRLRRHRNCSNKNNFIRKSHTHSLSNIATLGSVHVKSSDEVNNANPSKETSESAVIEIKKTTDYKTSDQQIKQTQKTKFGLWTCLCLRRRRHHLPYGLRSVPNNEPISKSTIITRKRKKKSPKSDQIDGVTNIDSNINKEEARSYRISLFLKDYEWFPRMTKRKTTIKDEEPVDTINTPDDIVSIIDVKTKKKIKNMERELKLTKINEEKMKEELKAKRVKEQEQKRRGFITQLTKDLMYQNNEENNQVKEKYNETASKTPVKSTVCTRNNKLKDKGNAYIFHSLASKSSSLGHCALAAGGHKLILTEETGTSTSTSSQNINTSVYPNDNHINKNGNAEFKSTVVENVRTNLKPAYNKNNSIIRSVSSIMTPVLPKEDMPVKEICSCYHIWHAEPMKNIVAQVHKLHPHCEGCRKHLKVKVMQVDETEIKKYGSEHNILDPHDLSIKDSLEIIRKRSFHNFRFEPRVNKEVVAMPMQETRGEQYEPIFLTNKRIQVQKWGDTHMEGRSNGGRQCLPYMTVEYTDNRPLKSKKKATIATNTTNQPATPKQKTADVSTLTSDWWSPLVERKVIPKKLKGNKVLDGKERNVIDCKEIAPDDTLSPSKYLLMSQQFYHQMYPRDMRESLSSYRFVRVMSKDQERVVLKSCARKVLKTKRLEACYSPRRITRTSTVNLVPAKWLPTISEEQAHALSYYRRSRTKPKHDNERSRSRLKSFNSTQSFHH